MYYRVAIQVDASPTWKWKSPALNSLTILFQWFQYYRALPLDRLRIFSSSSQQDLNEQLVRENQGLGSPSVPAIQFLQERRITSHGDLREASAGGTSKNERTVSIAVLTEPPPNESSSSPLDKRREELERGAGGDHDLPYSFALPLSMPQVLAWMRLLAKVQRGELQPQVVSERVAYLLFYCGLKPREIVRFCPQEQSSVYAIYGLRRTIMERLLRNADHLRWRLSQLGSDRAGKLTVTELLMLIEAGNVRTKNPLFWRLNIKKISG